jgi:hypothetical protein
MSNLDPETVANFVDATAVYVIYPSFNHEIVFTLGSVVLLWLGFLGVDAVRKLASMR